MSIFFNPFIMKKLLLTRLAMLAILAAVLTTVTGFAPALAYSVEGTQIAHNYATCTAFAACTPKVDTRAERLDAYFVKRDMPLHGYGAAFVAAADQYGLDWRLLPAIGVRESSGGKHLMNNNPFGWGSAKIPFKDFDEAIVEVTKHLAGEYPGTAKYYKDRTLEKKLWYYNGSVMPAYTGEVIDIMHKF